MKPNPKGCRERLTSTPRSLNTRESKNNLLSLNNINRRYLILEDQYKQMETEYNEKKEKIKEMIPSDEDYH